jgi:hypothetical protein
MSTIVGCLETIVAALRLRAVSKMKKRRVSSRKIDIPDRMPDKPLCIRYDELLHLRKAVEDAEAKVRKIQIENPSGRSVHH